MNITTEKLARIRAAAVIFRLCRELEQAQKYTLICELKRKDKPLKLPTELMNEAAREAVGKGR